mmetsp:Transcript_31592/g.69762  ORF Transcript_31592/g.69762 Transcript_31592/m.69762 type:complete len:592 (-) Transcript_31592:2-1777(-)
MKKAPPSRGRSSSLQLVGNTTVKAISKVPADTVGGLAGSAVSLERRSRATGHGHNQRSTSKTLTHSMARIADRDLVVELYGFPAPQAFRVGGKLGNAVIRSTVPTVHRGWRLVAVNGIRCTAEKAADVLQHAAQHARYTATFHLGDAHPEEDHSASERARVAAEGAEAEQREERERERRRAEAEEIERKYRAAEEASERKRQIESKRKQEEEEAAKQEEEKRLVKQRQEEEIARQKAEEETERRKAAQEAADKAAKQEREQAEAKAARAKREAEEAEVKRREEEEKKSREAATEAERKLRQEQELERERKRRKEAEEEESRRLLEEKRAKEEEDRRRAEELQKKAAEEEERRKREAETTVEHQEEMVQAEKKLQKTTGLPPKADVPEPQKALMTALTNPTPAVVRKPQGPCDKCDGKHDTDACPHFKNARDTHKDAWDNYGTKGVAGGKESQAILRAARVVAQPGDGSCLFHSLSYGLHATSASKLRAEIADYIAAHPNTQVSNNAIKDWVLWDSGMDTASYAQSMRTGSRWGGAIELAVCAKVKRVRVHVYEKGREGFTRISSFEGDVGPGSPTVNLLYGGRVHYDALQV